MVQPASIDGYWTSFGDWTMSDSFQFIDIIFFAMVAAFLVLRLRNVLGRRGGFKGQPRPPFPFQEDTDEEADAERSDDNVEDLAEHRLQTADRADETEDHVDIGMADAEEPLAIGLTQIARADANFNSEDFLVGARVAFEMIIDAFATGNAATLKGMLAADVFGNFAGAIKHREQAGETLDHTLVGLKKADIVEAFMDGRKSVITVKFVSEQVNVLIGADGEVVDGDPNAVDEVTDFWTFARDTRNKDPNWTLVATGSLE